MTPTKAGKKCRRCWEERAAQTTGLEGTREESKREKVVRHERRLEERK
jgi:hypothetical protein